MVKLIILEGARGVGKSTVARILRETLPSSTLINLTGFKENGEEGLSKICAYYRSWLTLFQTLQQRGETYVFILDRFFFSEMVFSRLYKSYDFDGSFGSFLNDLTTCGIDVNVFFLTVNEENLRVRLNRDKTDDFEEIAGSLEQSLAQQREYMHMLGITQDVLKLLGGHMRLVPVVTDWLEPRVIATVIKTFIEFI